MPVTTVSAQEILYKIAKDSGEMVAEFVSAISSPTVFMARGLLRDPHVTYKTALARIEGKGIRVITAWDPSNEQITVASGFDTAVAANDIVELIGWEATRRQLMFAALNDAIRVSFPYWWRETVVNAAASAITLASGTDVYSLPTDLSALIAFGIQPSASEPIRWWMIKDTRPDWFGVEGQEGDYKLRFAPRLTREGGFHEIYTGKKLCIKYAVREPQLTTESGTTQLPLAYFVVASMAYQMWTFGEDTGENAGARVSLDLQKYQMLAGMAQNELQKLMLAKVPPNPFVTPAPPPESEARRTRAQ